VACRSIDGIRGDGAPGGNCAACAHNQLSSVFDGGQFRCKAQKNLFAYDHNSRTPVILRLGPAALTRWKYTKAEIKMAGLPVIAFVFRVTTEYVDDAKGKYYIPVFNRVAELPIDQVVALRTIRKAAGVGLHKSASIVTDENDTARPAGAVDADYDELPPDVDPVIPGVQTAAKQPKADDDGLPF
jgi:hypothetical protein